jgi:hypothetical protein
LDVVIGMWYEFEQKNWIERTKDQLNYLA